MKYAGTSSTNDGQMTAHNQIISLKFYFLWLRASMIDIQTEKYQFQCSHGGEQVLARVTICPTFGQFRWSDKTMNMIINRSMTWKYIVSVFKSIRL